jgi:hypothetical protein
LSETSWNETPTALQGKLQQIPSTGPAVASQVPLQDMWWLLTAQRPGDMHERAQVAKTSFSRSIFPASSRIEEAMGGH